MKTYRIEYENGSVIEEGVEGKDLFIKLPAGSRPTGLQSKLHKDKPHAVYETTFGAKIVVYEKK